MRRGLKNEKRDVGADLRREFRHLSLTQARLEEFIHSQKNRRGIAASAAESRTVWDFFGQLNANVGGDSFVLQKNACGMKSEIIAVAGQGRIVAEEFDFARTRLFRNRDLIVNRDRRHQSFDFVIAVRAPAQDAKGKIDLRGRAKLDYFIGTNHAEGYRMNDQIKNPRDRIIVALDLPTAEQALDMVGKISGEVSFFKIGLQLYTAAGPEIVRAVLAKGGRVFLDLKLHDIPNTVGKAVRAAGDLGVEMLTLHLSGGRNMIEAAIRECPPHLLLLGVTVLTSSDDETLREIGVGEGVEEQTLRLARLGFAAGIRGLIASPHEVRALRKQFGEQMTIITPGVRPAWAKVDDQKRFTTPREAIENGADYLVIGRPITAATDPREAAQKIAAELA